MQITLSKADIKMLENILIQAKNAAEIEKPIKKKTRAQLKAELFKHWSETIK